ncbi:MAG: hypothetical protein ACRDNL_26290, partial [Spirillospora sp.]
RLGDGGLLASARDAYVHGMDAVLAACGAGALAAAALLWLFQPGREAEDAQDITNDTESTHENVVP